MTSDGREFLPSEKPQSRGAAYAASLMVLLFQPKHSIVGLAAELAVCDL